MNPIYKLLPSSRNEAIIAGSAYYYTAKKCVRGHTAPRYTSNKHCMECSSEDSRNLLQGRRLNRDWKFIELLTNAVYANGLFLRPVDGMTLTFLTGLKKALEQFQATYGAVLDQDSKELTARRLRIATEDLEAIAA